LVLATIQTAMAPSIQKKNKRTTYDIGHKKWNMVGNLTHQNHEHFTAVVLKTQMCAHTKTHNLLAAGNFLKDEHGNTTHSTRVESTSCTRGKPKKNIEWQIAIWWTAVLQNWWSCFSPPLHLTFLKSWTLLSREADISHQVSQLHSMRNLTHQAGKLEQLYLLKNAKPTYALALIIKGQ
jgi:hypothetical protein